MEASDGMNIAHFDSFNLDLTLTSTTDGLLLFLFEACV